MLQSNGDEKSIPSNLLGITKIFKRYKIFENCSIFSHLILLEFIIEMFQHNL